MNRWQLFITPLILLNMRLVKSFGFALNGIKYCLQEPNFKIHIGFSVLAMLLGFLLDISSLEWIIVTLCIALVLASEMFNTAIERLSNIVYPGFSQAIKIVKDVSAAAVLLIAMMAVVCGSIIFIPKMLAYFQNI